MRIAAPQPVPQAGTWLGELPVLVQEAVVDQLGYADLLRLAACSRAHRAAVAPALARFRGPPPAPPRGIEVHRPLLRSLRTAYPSERAARRHRAAARALDATDAAARVAAYACAYLPLGAVYLGARVAVGLHNAALPSSTERARWSAEPLAPAYLIQIFNDRWERATQQSPARMARYQAQIQARLSKCLGRAIAADSVKGVRWLLNLGARVDCPDANGTLPLRQAGARAGAAQRPIVEALIRVAHQNLQTAVRARDAARIEELAYVALPGWQLLDGNVKAYQALEEALALARRCRLRLPEPRGKSVPTVVGATTATMMGRLRS